MSDKQKVLVCGDVRGNFKALFTKIEVINKKSGPFDFLLCVGNFFGPTNIELEPYKNGMRHISVPTYVIGPNTEADVEHYPDIDGCEICPNLTYLGRRGLYNSSSGLKIAYISGVENSNSARSSGTYNFNQTDVTAIRDICLKGQPSFRGVDILLSSPWPQDVTNLDPNNPQFKYHGSKLVAWLAAHIKPRYHISGLEDIHYERPPYRNHAPNGDSIEIASRFIGLASVGNTQKKKWLYALNLTPVDRTRLCDLALGTTDETQSPYPLSLLNSKHSNQADDSRNTQFFYDMDSKDDKKRSKNRDGGFHKKPRPEFDQAKCWFCLSSPEVSKHLVISVGTEVYLALAKGGLVDDHFLILPVTHHASLSILPDNVAKEMKAFKKAVAKYYASTDRVPVFFERNYKTSHCQLQAVPVHKNQEPALKETFEEFSQSSNFQLDELPPRTQLEQIAPAGTPYFYVELPSGEMLYHRIRKSFPIQFGREALASDRILDMSDRADWKDCQLDKEEETQLAKKIRQQFQEYDPAA
ncbi:CWF19-like protein 1 [Neodiprion fabricii]|uniref:CWF19-like protein 1 n=1 Tax=Neodiprion fabricii TaxID=2872261 RepID=UPI001ED94998|nr:CWF19-like protein 1 [Neodiprion fabricii]